MFTTIAANIERLSQRPPTAFQNYLDQHGITRPAMRPPGQAAAMWGVPQRRTRR